MRFIYVLLSCISIVQMAFAKEITYAQIQAKLLEQEVLVLGHVYGGSGPTAQALAHWKYMQANEDGSGFKEKYGTAALVPESVAGQRGVVKAIFIANNFNTNAKAGSKDVFGNEIGSGQIINPYITVVVKLEDGSLIGATGYYKLLVGGQFQFTSIAEEEKKEIESQLTGLLGKTFYKTGYSRLIDPNITLQEFMQYRNRLAAQDTSTQNLTPLKVIDVKLLQKESAVAVKVSLPNGESRLLYGDVGLSRSSSSKSILEKLGIAIESTIPKKFSTTEIEAIRRRKIFVGMSEDALFWSWGAPEKINDWGNGGKQYIYTGGRYVYLNKKVIKNWQSIE